MGDFLRALGLLTVLPVRARWDDSVLPGRAMAVYPLAGALIGLLVALLAAGAGAVAPALLAASLALAGWAALTGLLHLDGWSDCCDGLLAPLERARRLEIMKDPRLGSFGVAGLVLLLLVKLAALDAVLSAAETPLVRLAPLVAIPALARWGVVIAAAAFPSARPGGMGDAFRRGLGRREVIVATVLAGLAAASLGWRGIVLWAVAGLATWGMARLAHGKLGGLTGDVYGAIVELGETAMLVAAACLI